MGAPSRDPAGTKLLSIPVNKTNKKHQFKKDSIITLNFLTNISQAL